jgi:hypothetical protein
VKVAERAFEEAIECALLENGPDACAGDPMIVRSRLNRTHPPMKTGTLVLDFATEADEIKAAFEPYYETTLLFTRHLAQVVRNGLGDRADTCIDPAVQIVQTRTVCVVSCQRNPEPVFLKWKGMEASPEGDFYVHSGPGSVRLAPDSAREYIWTRFSPGG